MHIQCDSVRFIIKGATTADVLSSISNPNPYLCTIVVTGRTNETIGDNHGTVVTDEVSSCDQLGAITEGAL